MNTKHAVLTSEHLFWIEGNRFHKEVLPHPCYNMVDIAELVYPYFITHLWVTPGGGEFQPMKKAEGWNFSPYENRKGAMMGANVRKQGHCMKDFEIIFPQHTAWYGTDQNHGWMRDADPQEVLITILYLESVLGVPVGSSPGRTGWNYLKTLHPEWIEELQGVDLKACHFDRTVAMDIIWDRPLIPGEGQKQYLHKFDKGAAYPYAASQTDIGVGTPVHVDNDLDAYHGKCHPQAVGVWRCSIAYSNAAYDATMPPAWKEDKKSSNKATECWLVGPVIRLLRSQRHTVVVHEGWVFPERHDVLVSWAAKMWDIRQGFDHEKWVNKRCAQLAKQATKQMANSMIGMTAFKDFDDEDEMKRPDIRLQVIGRHRELTWHNINKVKEVYGVTPVIVYMDAIYLLSDEPDGRKAFPELVKREGKLGGWRWEGRSSMNDAHIVLDAKMNEATKLEELNKIGWQK